jgi:hypothetical protein
VATHHRKSKLTTSLGSSKIRKTRAREFDPAKSDTSPSRHKILARNVKRDRFLGPNDDVGDEDQDSAGDGG